MADTAAGDTDNPFACLADLADTDAGVENAPDGNAFLLFGGDDAGSDAPVNARGVAHGGNTNTASRAGSSTVDVHDVNAVLFDPLGLGTMDAFGLFGFGSGSGAASNNSLTINDTLALPSSVGFSGWSAAAPFSGSSPLPAGFAATSTCDTSFVDISAMTRGVHPGGSTGVTSDLGLVGNASASAGLSAAFSAAPDQDQSAMAVSNDHGRNGPSFDASSPGFTVLPSSIQPPVQQAAQLSFPSSGHFDLPDQLCVNGGPSAPSTTVPPSVVTGSQALAASAPSEASDVTDSTNSAPGSGSPHGKKRRKQNYGPNTEPQLPKQQVHLLQQQQCAPGDVLTGLPQVVPVRMPAEPSAVEKCRKAAEDFANTKVFEKKRKAGDVSATEGDEQGKSSAKKQRSDGGDESDEGGEDERPEDVSHRKYQKRLLKNRNSAFVSRIRRREYTRILEESLDEKESENNELASAYNQVRHQLEVAYAELAALREAARSRAANIARSIVRPVGEAASNAATSSTAVVTMFMVAIFFGMLLPDFRQSANYSGMQYPTTGGHSTLSNRAAGPLALSSVDVTGAGGEKMKQSLSPRAIHALPFGTTSRSYLLQTCSEASEDDASMTEEPANMGDTLAKSEDSIDGGARSANRGRVWGPSIVHDDDCSSEPSSCPTMVDMEGDPAIDGEPATKQHLMSQLERNTTLLFGRDRASKVMELVERKVQDGVVSAQTLAIIAKKSAAGSFGAEISPWGPRLGRGKNMKVEPKEEPQMVGSGMSDVASKGLLQPDSLAVPQSFASWLQRLSVVADDRFAAEIGAFIAFHLIPSESSANSKLNIS